MKQATDTLHRHGPTPLLTVSDLATRWNVSRSTLYRLIASGKLKPIKLGPASTRFRPEDIVRTEQEAELQREVL